MAQQRDREADVGADDPLEGLERRLRRGQLRERPQRRDRTLAARAALPARAGEELPLEVREAQHLAAGELVRVGDPGRDQLEPALGRSGDQRAQLVVVAARGADLDDRAVLEQRRVTLEAVEREPVARRGQRARLRRVRVRRELEHDAVPRQRRRLVALHAHPHRPARAEREQRVRREPGEHVAVAHDLVPDHRAEPVDHRQAHGRDVRPRGRRGRAQVAVDPAQTDALAQRRPARVHRAHAAVGVHTAHDARPAPGRAQRAPVVGVGEVRQRAPDKVLVTEQRGARGVRERDRAVGVAGPDPVLGALDQRAVGRLRAPQQRVRLLLCGEPAPQFLGLGRDPVPLGRDGTCA